MKTFENNCFYYGFVTLGRPGVDILAIKTVIVAPTTDPTPKNKKNIDLKAPQVAQMSPNGAPGGRYTNALFQQFSVNFRPRALWAPPGGPGDPIFCGLGQLFVDFGVLSALFLVLTFNEFSSIFGR